MKQWQPVGDGEVSSFTYVDNGGKLLGVYAGNDDSDWYATDDLPDDVRLCRAVEVDTPQPVPVEAIMTLVIEAELGGRGLTAAKVRKWLDSLKGNSGDNQAWESSNNEWE